MKSRKDGCKPDTKQRKGDHQFQNQTALPNPKKLCAPADLRGNYILLYLRKLEV